jgi:rRNA biogenesis protein RRP5
MATSLI